MKTQIEKKTGLFTRFHASVRLLGLTGFLLGFATIILANPADLATSVKDIIAQIRSREFAIIPLLALVGFFIGFAAIAIELPRFKPRHYEIILDDRTISTEAMLIAVSNGRSYGGGMLVCPSANICDGLFDVMVLHPVSTIEFIKVFPRVFAGTHVSHPAVEIVRSRSVRIESKAVAYADGERIGQLPISAECIQSVLKTWVA